MYNRFNLAQFSIKIFRILNKKKEFLFGSANLEVIVRKELVITNGQIDEQQRSHNIRREDEQIGHRDRQDKHFESSIITARVGLGG
jgi:hypothetical protein